MYLPESNKGTFGSAQRWAGSAAAQNTTKPRPTKKDRRPASAPFNAAPPPGPGGHKKVGVRTPADMVGLPNGT